MRFFIASGLINHTFLQQELTCIRQQINPPKYGEHCHIFQPIDGHLAELSAAHGKLIGFLISHVNGLIHHNDFPLILFDKFFMGLSPIKNTINLYLQVGREIFDKTMFLLCSHKVYMETKKEQ